MQFKMVRDLVKQLLNNECLIVNYNEYGDGYDLSVRIDTQELNKVKCEERNNAKKED